MAQNCMKIPVRSFTPPLAALALLLLCVPSSGSFQVAAFEVATPPVYPTFAMNSNDDDDPPFRLGYVTDVEGNIDYFLRHVELSRVLSVQQSSDQSLRLDLMGRNSHFVYGGDAVDKGPGDIRLVRALVDLKRRYPQRVHLLVGNRDLNKLRFVAELSPDDLARSPEAIPPPHWDRKAPSLWQYLQPNRDDTRLNRLHYMLEHTLGCPQTFEFRRQELALLQGTLPTAIGDDQVLESFLFEVQDSQGSLRQYLELANVAVVIGNTLFCHGAVDANTMRFVPRDDTKFENPPRKPPPAAMVDDVHEWTAALNRYLRNGMADFRRRPHFDADRTGRGGESLMALQNRPAMWGRSIVSNCYGDGGCITTDFAAQERIDIERIALESPTTDPLLFEGVCSDPMDARVAQWLQKDGIQRVVVGHKPTGDCPAVLSALHTGVEIVSADTSFSDTSAADNRGRAASAVEIVGASPTDNQLVLEGILRDGTRYESHFCRLHPGGVDVSLGDANLGRRIGGGYWVKVATDRDTYWLCRGKGRHVEYAEMATAELQLQLQGSMHTVS